MSSWHSNSYGCGSSSGWQCKVCSTSNWPKHKCCWTCKAQRSYAEAAASASNISFEKEKNGAIVQPGRIRNAGQSLHQQLGLITKQLVQVAAPASDITCLPVPSPANAAEDRTALSSQLQQLETSLAALPDCQDFAPIRSQLTKRIEEAKSKICSAKPLVARLDGCRGALERGRQRLATADAAVQAATLARNTAAAQVAKFKSELAELEAMVAEDAKKKESSTCLSRLQKEMQQIVNEMTCSAHVEGVEAASAMQQMAALFQNLSSIALKSQAASLQATLPGSACPTQGAIAAAAPALAQQAEKMRLQQMLIQNASNVAHTVALPPLPGSPVMPSEQMDVDNAVLGGGQAVAASGGG